MFVTLRLISAGKYPNRLPRTGSGGRGCKSLANLRDTSYDNAIVMSPLEVIRWLLAAKRGEDKPGSGELTYGRIGLT